jgi:hypothetical protein
MGYHYPKEMGGCSHRPFMGMMVINFSAAYLLPLVLYLAVR